ncbi:ATP-dependent helicase [Neobacillus drentensis]|uniref:UvrD-helicase domain-containing protein n=1 Tax=Neobacillus drentensis TaxID=220684 RepID=UPI0030009767
MEHLYSELIIGKKQSINISYLQKKVLSGTKVIVLTDEEILWPEEASRKLLKESMLFQVYTNHSFPFTEITRSYWNGLGVEEIEGVLEKYFPAFNSKQFLIEHSSTEKPALIMAGAGSGKTTVMVQRIMYLLKHINIAPDTIAMITFTREAAKNMFEKLSDALYMRFQITKKAEYLFDIEKLNSIQISTIDSFLYKLFRQLGSVIGISANVQIRNYKRERQELIESVVNHYISELERNKKNTVFLNNLYTHIRDYEFVKIIDLFWGEFEKKGIQISSKEALQELFGESDSVHKSFQDLIIHVIRECDEQFRTQQIQENAVTISSLSKMTDTLIEADPSALEQIHLSYQHLFIDEFQDSSDFQIKLAQLFAGRLNMNLFVVGDVKQSIYRFRGADESAFEKLQQGSLQSENWNSFSLRQNYRTSRVLLELLDRKYFSLWDGYFPYSDSDRLISFKKKEKSAVPLIVYPLNYEEQRECRSHVVEWIQSLKDQFKDKDPQKYKIAVLTRTRKEARLVAQWCENEQIPFHLDIGGTLFENSAARDLNRLLHALAFPGDTVYMCDYLLTPYSKVQVDPTFLLKADSNAEALKQLLNPYTQTLHNYQDEARRIPVLSLIRRIIEESEVVRRYYEIELQNGAGEEEAERKALAYELNLGRLLDVITEQYIGDYVSLHSLLTWFNIQLKINRNEDEAKDEKLTVNAVNILTVHRSKGLEYHTVIIPFTDRYFYTSLMNSTLVFNNDKTKAGWQITARGRAADRSEDIHFSNKNFGSISRSSQFSEGKMSEEKAIEAEELRLLYVAMTRAEEQLWVIKYTTKPNKPCWAKYLQIHRPSEREEI